jgi:hypothetical protein
VQDLAAHRAAQLDLRDLAAQGDPKLASKIPARYAYTAMDGRPGS